MPRTLEEQRREFAERRGLAMPLAGAIAWTIVGVASVFLTPILEVWLLFGAVGAIAGLGIFRFVAVPAVIVIIYAVTIVVLEARWRRALPANSQAGR